MAYHASDSRRIGKFILEQDGVRFWRHLKTDYYPNGTQLSAETGARKNDKSPPPKSKKKKTKKDKTRKGKSKHGEV